MLSSSSSSESGLGKELQGVGVHGVMGWVGLGWDRGGGVGWGAKRTTCILQ